MLKTTQLLLLLAGEQPLSPFILKVLNDEMFLVHIRLFFCLPQVAVGKVATILVTYTSSGGLSHYSCPINFYGRLYRDIKVSTMRLETGLSSGVLTVKLWPVGRV